MKNSSTRTMTAKRIAVAVAAVCATMSAPSFAAGTDMKALMDLLLKKGVITQQEYDQNIQAAVENEAFKEKRTADDLKNLNNIAIKNKDTGSVMKNGIGIQSPDGLYTCRFSGQRDGGAQAPPWRHLQPSLWQLKRDETGAYCAWTCWFFSLARPW
jgi:hypothetical protein